MSDDRLSHIDDEGLARMVDIGDKKPSDRRAIAQARIRVSPSTARAIEREDVPKGDVLGTARLAGIQAAKRTDELIPLAHSLPLTFIDISTALDTENGIVEIEAEARTIERTGVEMEAMIACAVAALTVYDMVKGIERGVEVDRIALVEKTGGKADWHRPD